MHLPCVRYFGQHEFSATSNNLDYVRQPDLSKHIGQGKFELLQKMPKNEGKMSIWFEKRISF